MWLLPQPGHSEQQHRMAVAHEVELGQIGDHLGIDRGLEVEVELLEGPAEREVCEAQPGREPPLACGVDLAGDDFGQELLEEVGHT